MRSLTLVAAVLALGASAAAESVVRDMHGDAERWHRDRVSLVYSPAALQSAGFENLETALREASAAWSSVAGAPRLDPTPGDPGSIGFAPGPGNVSGVYVSHDGLPGVQGDALAVTLVTTNVETGEILDTDVVFNARDHRFAALGPEGLSGSASVPYDLQNTLTHELGHVLGLGEDPAHPLATMYPTSMPGEVQKRTLDHEDVASVETAYAGILAPEPSSATTEPVANAGCGGAHIAPHARRDETVWWLAAVGVSLAAFFSRRHRARLGALVLSASCLVAAAPTPPSLRAGEARVVSRTAAWHGTTIHTHAVVRDANGVEHAIDALGGRVGPFAMHVYGAPDGALLEPGATISLSRAP